MANLFRFLEKKERGFVDPELDYPVAALKDIQQRSLTSLGLPREPWPPADPREDKIILMHIRAMSQQRKLLNAVELKNTLESQYRVYVTMLTNRWLAYNFTTQAKTYNQYRYIITGNGAHLANFCNKHKHDLNPDPTLTERGANTTYERWWVAVMFSGLRHKQEE